LVGIYTYQADESILDSWDEDRRKKYNEMINPLSQDNIRRLFNQDTDTAGKKDTFFLTLKRAQHDREFSRAMQKVRVLASEEPSCRLTCSFQGLNSLRTDFTKFYGK
jgi:hypothetical protein